MGKSSMGKILLALTGAAAFAFAGGAQAADLPFKAAPITPLPTVSGYVGLYGGGTWADYYWTEGCCSQAHSSAFVYGAEGRLNWWTAPNWAMQVDVEAEGTGGLQEFCQGCTPKNPRAHGIAGAHYAWRDPANYAIGVFGGGLASGSLDNDGTNQYGFIGLEAQKYFNQFTLYAQGGFISRFAGPNEGVLSDGWFIRGEGRYFFTPNDRLSAEVGYLEGNIANNNPGKQNNLNWGATYEHLLMNMPISLFLSYQGNTYRDTGNTAGRSCSFGGGNRATENIVLAGFRLYVNENTLLFNDRKGATWNMPKFRGMSWGDVVNEGASSGLNNC